MSQSAALTMTAEHAPPNLLTRLVRLVGYLTDPKSAPGKIFGAWERTVTGLAERLATSERYLRFAGRGLEASFRLRKNMIDAAEEALHLARLPSVSEVNELRHQVRVMSDRLEVTQSQLELALEILGRMEKRSMAADASPAADAAEEVAS